MKGAKQRSSLVISCWILSPGAIVLFVCMLFFSHFPVFHACSFDGSFTFNFGFWWDFVLISYFPQMLWFILFSFILGFLYFLVLLSFASCFWHGIFLFPSCPS